MANPSFITFNESGWPVLDIGRMRHQITIQASVPKSPAVYDAGGPVTAAPQTVAQAMAAIDAIRGTDVIKGGQTATQLFLTVGIWYQPGIQPNMTVLSDNGSLYVIQSIENIRELDVVLILNCLGIGNNQ